MFNYLQKRILLSLLTLFFVLTLSFVLLRVLPGDPVQLLAMPGVPFTQLENIREQYHLNDSIAIQYFYFIKDVCRGDFGQSIRRGQPAFEVVVRGIGPTIKLAGFSLAFAILISIPSGIIAAYRKNKAIDRFVLVESTFFQALPNFWVGILLLLILSIRINVLPAFTGSTSFPNLILPGVSLAVGLIATLTRLTRSALVEVLKEDYIKTARAKGSSELSVVLYHGLPNILVLIITVMGIQVGYVLGGALIVENLFAWPGLGSIVVQAVNTRDYPVIQAGILVLAIIIILVNILVDLLYAFIDPRIRLSRR
jgi:peptide/nickel transport system permease protein